MGATTSRSAPASSAALPPSVGSLIDRLPAGRFAALHLLRLMSLNACFAYVLEGNPFVYPGMSSEFGLSAAVEALYASAFTFGGIFGAASVSLQDICGRRIIICMGSVVAAFAMLVLAVSSPFALVCVVRFFLGWAFVSMQNGWNGWFAEQLPVINRGPIYVALTAGYPVGRLGVIFTASALEASQWRVLIYANAGLLVIVAAVAFFISESPRHLSVTGREAEARRAVHAMYTFNRTHLPYDERVARTLETPKDQPPPPTEEDPLLGRDRPPPQAPPSQQLDGYHIVPRATVKWTNVCRAPPPSLGYAVVLFCGLSAQQALIQNFGPRIFQKLIYPSWTDNARTLPYSVLLIFNSTDWGGILLSVLLIDRLGRRGFFSVGFSVAAVLWAACALVRPIWGEPITADGGDDNSDALGAVLIVLGALASATRGFAPEAANLWVLETFATDQRATCYAVVQVAYQLTASVIVPLGGILVDAVDYSPTPLLLTYAAIQIALGVFTLFLPNETANVALQDVSTGVAPGATPGADPDGDPTADAKKKGPADSKLGADTHTTPAAHKAMSAAPPVAALREDVLR